MSRCGRMVGEWWGVSDVIRVSISAEFRQATKAYWNQVFMLSHATNKSLCPNKLITLLGDSTTTSKAFLFELQTCSDLPMPPYRLHRAHRSITLSLSMSRQSPNYAVRLRPHHRIAIATDNHKIRRQQQQQEALAITTCTQPLEASWRTPLLKWPWGLLDRASALDNSTWSRTYVYAFSG
jgi:hypothetical protein